MLLAQNIDNNSDYIKYNNNSIVKGKVKLGISFNNKLFVNVNDSLIYNFSNIKTIKYDDKYFRLIHEFRVKENKNVTKDIIFKRIIDKKLDVYARYSLENPESKVYDYFSISSDVIYKINYENLNKHIQNDDFSRKYLGQYKLFNELAIKLLFTGFATYVYGYFSDNKYASTFEIIGISMAVTSIIPFALQSNRLEKAINTYNR